MIQRMSPLWAVRTMLIAGFLLVLAANLPGQMSWDSVFALYQVRHNIPLSFDPPVMNLLLGVFDKIVPGPALFVTANVLLYFGSLLSFMQLRERTTWLGLPAAVLICLSPLILITQGTVWHDVLFADLAVAGFACLGAAAKNWQNEPIRLSALGVLILLLSMAALSRQNGIICLPVACFAVYLIARKTDPARAIRIGLSFAGLAFAFVIALNAAFSLGHANASYGSGLQDLQEFDIVGVASIDPTIDLSIIDHNSPALVAMVRSQAKGFTPQRLAYVAQNAPQLWSFLESSPPTAIRDQWWTIVIHHPVDYVRERAAVFTWTFLTPEIEKCLPVFVGIGGKPEWVTSLGLQLGARAQDQALYGYATRLLHTPYYSHLFYALVSIVLAILLIRRGDRQDIAIAALLTSGLLVAASYFVISISCDFRFLFFLDISSLAGLLYFAIDPTWRRRPTL